MATPTEEFEQIVDPVTERVKETVFGFDRVTRMLTGAFLFGGHVLIEGPPGIAKTLLARTISEALGLEFKRIQFTPDLMPSDITGVDIFDQRSGTFRFAPGPVFADVLLADEINRTPPKTQSALLEAMEERRVTVDGKSHPLSQVFFVIATQNPLEYEGTFPLPEAQLDRFFLKLTMGYPPRAAEEQMIHAFSTAPHSGLATRERHVEGSPSGCPSRLAELSGVRRAVRQVILSPPVAGYILDLVERSRSHPALLLGASPRAALHLALAAKLHALLERRGYVLPDDVKQMVSPVLAHRVMLRPAAYGEDLEPSEILGEILESVPIPEGASERTR